MESLVVQVALYGLDELVWFTYQLQITKQAASIKNNCMWETKCNHLDA